jgi:hypothetical protein
VLFENIFGIVIVAPLNHFFADLNNPSYARMAFSAWRITQQFNYTKNLPKHFENTSLSRKFRGLQLTTSSPHNIYCHGGREKGRAANAMRDL